MMARLHTEVLPYRIYALVLEDSVFVGKTAARRLSQVFSRHRTGAVKATRGILDQQTPPTRHLLEELRCTGAEAYKHVLAWIAYLEQAGYSSINQVKTIDAADTLYPRTEEILHALPQKPVKALLAETRLKKPTDGDRKPERASIFQKKPERTVQLNLRMSPSDRKKLQSYCKTHNLRTREAVGILLDQAAREDTHLRRIQTAYQKELNMLRRTYEKKQSGAEERAESFLTFLRPGLSDFLRWICPEGDPLPTMPYNRFRRQLPRGVHYEFPAREGFFRIKPEWILYGRNHAKFLVGRGEKGEHWKLRSYDRPLYAGLPVATDGWWVVGCRKAGDGAMEIAAAFPIPSVPRNPEKEETRKERKRPLDEQIRGAKERT